MNSGPGLDIKTWPLSESEDQNVVCNESGPREASPPFDIGDDPGKSKLQIFGLVHIARIQCRLALENVGPSGSAEETFN